MDGVISLGITFLLSLQVCGRPSYYRENRFADDVAYHSGRFYNKLDLHDSRKHDDSELESNSWKHYPENGRARETNARNANLGVSVENAHDDSMFHEQKVPSATNRYENNYVRHGEARGLDSKENDDSSLEGHHKLPFQNHKGALGSHSNGNDDSLGEYGSWENRHGKGHVTTDDELLQVEAREGRINANDDSAASEEENMAEAALASKFSGRGNDVNEPLDNRVDIFHKRYFTLNCRDCCKSSSCARANRLCRCFR